MREVSNWPGHWFGVAAAALLVFGAAEAFATERLFAPAEEWRRGETENSCIMRRTFGIAEPDRISFQLQTFGVPGDMLLTMVGAGLPLRQGMQRGVAKFSYRFEPDPDSDWRHAFGATGQIGGVDALTFPADFGSRAEMERRLEAGRNALSGESDEAYLAARAAEIERFVFAYPSRYDTVLQIGDMADPYRWLEECNASLLEKWGFDPAAIAALKTRPALSNGQEVARAILLEMRKARMGHNTPIQFRLKVDAAGNPADCLVLYPGRGSDVEAKICEVIVKKAKFEPALDAAGTPVAAPSVQRVVFGLG